MGQSCSDNKAAECKEGGGPIGPLIMVTPPDGTVRFVPASQAQYALGQGPGGVPMTPPAGTGSTMGGPPVVSFTASTRGQTPQPHPTRRQQQQPLNASGYPLGATRNAGTRNNAAVQDFSQALAAFANTGDDRSECASSVILGERTFVAADGTTRGTPSLLGTGKAPPLHTKKSLPPVHTVRSATPPGRSVVLTSTSSSPRASSAGGSPTSRYLAPQPVQQQQHVQLQRGPMGVGQQPPVRRMGKQPPPQQQQLQQQHRLGATGVQQQRLVQLPLPAHQRHQPQHRPQKGIHPPPTGGSVPVHRQESGAGPLLRRQQPPLSEQPRVRSPGRPAPRAPTADGREFSSPPEERILSSADLLKAHGLFIDEGNQRRFLETDQRRALRRLCENLEDACSETQHRNDMQRMWTAMEAATRTPPPSAYAASTGAGGARPSSAGRRGRPIAPFSDRPSSMPPPPVPPPVVVAAVPELSQQEPLYYDPYEEAAALSPLRQQQKRLRAKQRQHMCDTEAADRQTLIHRESVARSAIITELSKVCEDLAVKARIAQQQSWLEESKQTYRDAGGPAAGARTPEGKGPRRTAPKLPPGTAATQEGAAYAPGDEAGQEHHPSYFSTSASRTPPPAACNASSRALRDGSISATASRLMSLSAY